MTMPPSRPIQVPAARISLSALAPLEQHIQQEHTRQENNHNQRKVSHSGERQRETSAKVAAPYLALLPLVLCDV
jgi:hypothetical protein